ncbi:MAG: fumarylacetoacetate hydrolase family protein [Bdellovibrionales bacterium]|nr:fumarylacetoacetate hydrolase family protein [Bdellovibrionales bacterium]
MAAWKWERVGSIWAVGRNYADHAAEMNAPVPTRPLVFLKSGGSIIPAKGPKGTVRLPKLESEIHHELELALLLGEGLKVVGVSLALDLTARDIQAEAKKKGEPWTLAKSFIGACPVGPVQKFMGWRAFSKLEFRLTVNGQVRQHGKASQMIFNGPHLMKYLRSHFPVRPGDMILTGTPQGVGPLVKGDLVLAQILGPVPVDWTVKIS